MALQYFLYDTNFGETIVDRSNSSFTPAPPYEEIYIDFFIPETQPLYLYAVSGGTGGTIIVNAQENIDAYLSATQLPPTAEGNVTYGQFTATTTQTNQKVATISAATNNKLDKTTFATYSGITVPNTYYNKTQINAYSASTLTNINSRLLKADFNTFSGTTLPATYLSKTAFNTYSGTTVPNTYYNKTQINAYSASTLTNINSRLLKTDFTTFTGTTSAIYTNTQDPTGFINNQNIRLTYNSTNRTITLSAITGTIQYYWNGVLKSLGTSWTSTAHPATTLAYYLYSTDGINFTWSTTVWAFTDVMVTFKPKGMGIAIREVHGIMQWSVHEELHRNFGTYKVNGGGFTVGTYTIQPASPTNADNTFGLEAITIADEDIKTSLPAWIQDSYTTLYFTGSGATVFETLQPNYARVTGTFPNYYSWNGSTFTTTEMANNYYANYYVLRVPVVSDATSQLYRAIVMSPQYAYSTAASAYAEGVESLYFGDLAALFTEGVIVERITIRTNSSYTSTGRYRINAINIITGTRFSQVVGAVGAATTAGNVTVVPTLPYTQTNLQLLSDAYAIDITASLRKTTFATYTGTTVPNTYYNKTQINSYTGATATAISNKIDKVGAAVATDIATFVSGGNVQDSGKQFINIVNPAISALDAKVPTELAVRNAINQAVAGAIVLQGNWDATTNTPDLTVTGITTGFAWRVSVSGTTNLGGITIWAVGDLAVKSATGWVKLDNEDIAAIWGNISGTLSNQTDLQNALNAKLNVTSFNIYSASTLTNINSRIPKVTGATNNLAVFAANGNVVNSNVTLAQLTGGTGYYVYGESDVTLNTTSLTPILYLTTGGTLTAGRFSLDYMGVVGNAAKTKAGYVQFYLDGSPISSAYAYTPPENNGVFPISFLKDLELTAGPHTFSVYYYAGTATAIITRAAIRVRKVN